MEGLSRVKGIMTRKLYDLLQESGVKRKDSELAEILGTRPGNVRVLKTRLRRYGLLPPRELKPKREACPKCDNGYITITKDGTTKYTKCPYCKDYHPQGA